MSATWRIVTPRGSSGAIAIIQIEGDDVEDALGLVGLAPMAVGQVALQDLLGIDRGLVMRPSVGCAQLMPHGGKAVVEAITARLEQAGVASVEQGAVSDAAVRAVFPEAQTLIEARMLEALSHAQSPRAIDLLLDQPGRWALPGAESDPMLDAERQRLIVPPLVVAAGPPNIGKSTLLNAFAGRAVAIVSDEPGTTRDHVGVMLDLDGLSVRYVDTPGIRDGGPSVECEARAIADRVIERADLVLACGDWSAMPPAELAERAMLVALRRDLGEPSFAAEARVSALSGQGIDELARQIRQRLVSDRAIESDCPWRFWGEPGLHEL